jgi:uncharacterized protein YukE
MPSANALITVICLSMFRTFAIRGVSLLTEIIVIRKPLAVRCFCITFTLAAFLYQAESAPAYQAAAQSNQAADSQPAPSVQPPQRAAEAPISPDNAEPAADKIKRAEWVAIFINGFVALAVFWTAWTYHQQRKLMHRQLVAMKGQLRVMRDERKAIRGQAKTLEVQAETMKGQLEVMERQWRGSLAAVRPIVEIVIWLEPPKDIVIVLQNIGKSRASVQFSYKFTFDNRIVLSGEVSEFEIDISGQKGHGEWRHTLTTSMTDDEAAEVNSQRVRLKAELTGRYWWEADSYPISICRKSGDYFSGRSFGTPC